MARRKKAAVDVPATREEAEQIAFQYAGVERELALREVETDKRIDAAKASLAEERAAVKDIQSQRFAQLEAYWNANEAEAASKRRRSIKLGPLTIGERLSTPKLKLPKGMDAKGVIGLFKSLRDGGQMSRRFTRTKEPTLDRQALIKAIQTTKGVAAKTADWLATHGFAISQTDEFFVKVPEEEEANI